MFEDISTPNHEPLEVSDFEDDPGVEEENVEDETAVPPSLPQFQACSLPVQVPARFTSWKVKEPPKAVPASSSPTPAPQTSLSTSVNPSNSITTKDAIAESSNPVAASSLSTGETSTDPETPIIDAFGLVPQQLSEDEKKFVVPHELIIQQENADELSRSFAVPLSLTRSRPGFL